ncbi:tRNA lysidine(34) synthetase TilS [Bailinhaonella thermotolerans]|uniref:tRNA(Ile)-lysidine synthase n=1 Tax=Bailinhaonella thermotolerans TaxID=1070861 RepID=A0A3A4ASX2_9ACTN|nr:tRNA lysidine(34) synthetase TilS [Bailinhaonella thermotolerans]RJL22577.1 tRNA lysidine(34) synthetase TilS [Bailinhaonella thermotolerans]
MGPHPAVATVRHAVRRALADLAAGDLVLVACSGGADSLALAAAAGFTAPRAGLRAGLLTVDHGLQAGSAARALDVVRLAPELKLEPAEVLTVRVGTAGGPEAAARDARYAALGEAARRHGAAAVLLGHTLDDQAETVVLGLARGSGPRSLAAMSAVAGVYRRPLLEIGRATTRAACAALGLTPWDDPHNDDPAFSRVRVRHRVLPVLERELGPGIAGALARTAALCRDDADALDAWASRAHAEARAAAADPGGSGREPYAGAEGGSGREPYARAEGGSGREGGAGAAGGEALAVAVLADLPPAVRGRVLRLAAFAAGVPAGSLGAAHVREADRLVTEWRGQRGVNLPGGVTLYRRYGRLVFAGNG